MDKKVTKPPDMAITARNEAMMNMLMQPVQKPKVSEKKTKKVK